MEEQRKLKKSVRIYQAKEAAQELKEERAGAEGEARAILRNVPTSPRKMRLVADLIRGKRVDIALGILRFEPKVGASYLETLLISAIANWSEKNSDTPIEDANLYIKEIYVDSARMLKRLRPAPQGRGHRIRKRSNHVTMVVDSLENIEGELNLEESLNEQEENA